MTNYEALISLDKETLANILDQIYLTGLNDGSREGEDYHFPYDEDWLSQEAEAAFSPTDPENPELLNGLVRAIFRSAGVEYD